LVFLAKYAKYAKIRTPHTIKIYEKVVQDFSLIPPIKILTSEQLNGANGAFSAQTNTISLYSALFPDNNVNLITCVLGAGNDVLTGGSRDDRFVLTNEGIDTITGFNGLDSDLAPVP
jgi:Ca2+-binding RTX toxin-like protein